MKFGYNLKVAVIGTSTLVGSANAEGRGPVSDFAESRWFVSLRTPLHL